MRWAENQLAEWEARQRTFAMKSLDDETPDDGPESKLQSKCLKYCKERGFPVFHDWSQSRNAAGWHDLTIYAKNRIILVELKSATGKLRKEQAALKQTLSWLGHTVHVCKSYAGFIKIMTMEIENAKKTNGVK